MNRNGLCTIAAFNKEVDEQLAKEVAMQIAAMNPIAIDEDGVSEEVIINNSACTFYSQVAIKLHLLTCNTARCV